MTKFKKDPLALIRWFLGLTFVVYGVSKFADYSNSVGFFNSIGFAAAVLVFVALAEILAGLALLANKFTKWASMVIIVIMLVAIFKVKLSLGYFGGYEIDVVYGVMALAILFSVCDWGKKKEVVAVAE